MTDHVLIYMRGENLREVAWTLLEDGLIELADSMVRYEAYLKDGSRRKMSSTRKCMTLLARQEALDAVMSFIRQVQREQDVSAYAVPVLAMA